MSFARWHCCRIIMQRWCRPLLLECIEHQDRVLHCTALYCTVLYCTVLYNGRSPSLCCRTNHTSLLKLLFQPFSPSPLRQPKAWRLWFEGSKATAQFWFVCYPPVPKSFLQIYITSGGNHLTVATINFFNDAVRSTSNMQSICGRGKTVTNWISTRGIPRQVSILLASASVSKITE